MIQFKFGNNFRNLDYSTRIRSNQSKKAKFWQMCNYYLNDSIEILGLSMSQTKNLAASRRGMQEEAAPKTAV